MTPLYKIPVAWSNVWAKLENQNPTGTHKDRSMKPWVEQCAKGGVRELAISSSGNSAISAGKFCDENNIKLHVFVSPSIDEEKIDRLTACRSVILNITKTPIKDVLQFCRRSKIPNLRASTDDNALLGYKDISLELMKQLPSTDNIFIPTSSGATLEGMYMGFKIKNLKFKNKKMPALFAVQTAKVHPIASYFDKDFVPEKTSYATAIVDNIAHRRDRIIKIIRETGGGGFVISNRELGEARRHLAEIFTVNFGIHSALAFAGFLKWQKRNPRKSLRQNSICLFTS